LSAFSLAQVREFQVLGHRTGPGPALGNGLAQAVGRFGLALHQVDLLRRPRRRQDPVEQALPVGMA